MRNVTIAATQMKCDLNPDINIRKAETLVREAASKGANVILLQELFSSWYFCQEFDFKYFDWANEASENTMLKKFSELAAELNVVLPISFFEKKNNCFYNTIMMIDADGTQMGIYRKTHIPDDPGYYEKFYFTPGDTGFKVWNTKFGKIGIGVCWDQWFPEAARCMVLQGAEILLYPTAIGTYAVPRNEVEKAEDNHIHWQNVMRGHAAANIVPVVASNRVGIESFGSTSIRFGGASFISDQCGCIVNEMDGAEESTITATFDLDFIAQERVRAVVFRDRRPECYTALFSLDGCLK